MQEIQEIPELTINWHILEQCNFRCKHCYAIFPDKKPIFQTHYKKVLEELKKLKNKTLLLRSLPIKANSIRINFAGGEPFLFKEIGSAIELAHEFGLHPSFISNGSETDDDFIKKYGRMISVAGFSIDSFSEAVNKKIGRCEKRDGRQVSSERFKKIINLFREHSPKTVIKINTVVCRDNIDDNISNFICDLKPDRWKILQVIPIHGATNNGISDEEFNTYVEKQNIPLLHNKIPDIVVEDNRTMSRSYLMLNPQTQFYQRDGSDYITSDRVVDVGAEKALRSVEFDSEIYLERYPDSPQASTGDDAQ